ncbi:MAG: RNA 2',3'-cyclic phosphodiesterase [Candidatus Aenigmarchaeota archaeon]|nr:RNA 2',3'-cyclic phosphodiesterase [Candidatus Aenigmarchaeota archaeon]
MLRLFTCVWVPTHIRQKIVELQEEMKNLPIKTKFVETENLHLTVTFLGNKNENELETLKNKLDESVKNVRKFHVVLEGLKVIPNENYIRVIGIQVVSKEMENLIKKVAELIDGNYHETTKLTLCRVKKLFDKKILKNFIEKNRHIKIGEFEVQSVALVKSSLTRQGPIYETIHESFLK